MYVCGYVHMYVWGCVDVYVEGYGHMNTEH